MLFIASILATSCRISRTNTKRRHKPRGEYINLPFYQIFTNICAYLKIQKKNTLLFACWSWKMHIIYDCSLFMGMPKAAKNVIYIKRVNGLGDATRQKHMCAYWACFICGQFNGIFRYIFLLFAQRANNAFSVWCPCIRGIFKFCKSIKHFSPMNNACQVTGYKGFPTAKRTNTFRVYSWRGPRPRLNLPGIDARHFLSH